MKFDIKRGGVTVANIHPEGTVQEVVNGEHIATVNFTLPVFVDFYKGDKIVIFGNTYVLSRAADWRKESEREFVYNLAFVAENYRLLEIGFLAPGEDSVLTNPSAPLMANAEAVIDLVILNANRIDSGWTKGVIDETETLQHAFNEDNCRGVLTKLADTYQTEFWFNGKTINFTKKGNNSGLSFRYGKGNGLTSLTRKVQNKQVTTRLYVKGSDRNLPTNYPGGVLRMPDSALFIEDIDKVNKYGRIEGFKTFENIYPKRVGTITAVIDAFTFIDNTLDFDINPQRIDGVSVKVSFITGDLAGWEFEMPLDGYNHTTKAITIIRNTDEKAIEVPSETGLKPAVGNKYVLLDLVMPSTYVTAEENKLYDAGVEEYNSICDEAVNYTAPTFSKYLKENGISVNLGDYVNIAEQNPLIDKNIRVIGKTTNIQDQYDITLELADTVAIANVVRERIASKAIQRAINANKLSDINRTRQNRKTQAEVINMVFNPETGKFLNNKLDVDWLSAQLITVGSKAGDFLLTTTFVPGYQGDVNKLGWLAGWLSHNELTTYQNGIWDFAAGVLSGLDPAKAYYIYAYCPFGSDTATLTVSDQVITVEQIANQYTFSIGILSSVIDGFRTVSNTKGKTVINGGEIQTGLMKNQSGQPVLDLDTRTFYGAFKFGNGDDVQAVTNQIAAVAGTASVNAGNALASATQAVQDAADALDRANDAVADAAVIAVLVNDIASDNKLTPSEKQLILKDWQIIVGEKPTIVASAQTYNLSYTAFESAYNTLSGYLSPLLSNINTTSDIVGQTLRDRFKAYNDAKVDLLKLVSDAAKGLVDNIQVGGRNLILQSDISITGQTYHNLDFTDVQNWRGKTLTVSINYEVVNVLNGSGRLGIEPCIGFSDGTQQYISAWLYPTIGFTGKGRLVNTINIEDKEIVGLIQTGMYIQVDADFVKISRPKLEIGNKPTDWTPAIEDIEADYTAKANAAQIAAQDYALVESVLKREQAKAYADGIVSDEEQARIDQAAANLQAAKDDALAKANAAVAAVSIGGTNLALNSRSTDFLAGVIDNTKIYKGESTIRFTRLQTVYGNFIRVEPNTFYTFSAMVSASSNWLSYGDNVPLHFHVRDIAQSHNSFSTIVSMDEDLSEDWKLIHITLKTLPEAYYFVPILYTPHETMPEYINFAWFKFEKGNKATDWTPAPEDVQEGIDEAYNTALTAINTANDAADIAAIAAQAAADALAQASNAESTAERAANITDYLFTTVDGNVVATGTLLVGDALGNNNAGISGVVAGVPASSVRFWAGATFDNRNTAPFRVQQNGKVFMSDAIIQGELNAGKVGGFTISGGSILSNNPFVNSERGVFELNSGQNPSLTLRSEYRPNPSVIINTFGVRLHEFGVDVGALLVYRESIFEGTVTFEDTVVFNAAITLAGKATFNQEAVFNQMVNFNKVGGAFGNCDVRLEDAPTFSGGSNYRQLYVNINTGRIFRQV